MPHKFEYFKIHHPQGHFCHDSSFITVKCYDLCSLLEVEILTSIPKVFVENSQYENLNFVYYFTCLTMQVDPCFKMKLVKYHLGDVRFLLKEDWFAYILQLCHHFKHFAMSLQEFLNLTKSDQIRLLHQNVPIYVQLILSMYFNGQSGSEQLNCLPGIEVPDNHSYQRVRLNVMNKQLGLFHPNAAFDYYRWKLSDSPLKVKTYLGMM